MYKKHIFSLIMAVLLSVSLLSFNCFAFEFEGENRSITDIYSDWFISSRDFCYGNITFEQWRNANIRFQTDILGSNLFPGTDTEFQEFDTAIEDYFRTAAESTDTKVDDKFLDYFGKAVETVGVFNFRDQFETWYQDKYGKEYGAHENSFSSNFETTGYSYYIFSHSTGYEHKVFFTYSGAPIKVTESSNGLQSFSGYQLGTITYRSYKRTQYATGDWGDWEGGKQEYTGVISGTYILNASEASGSSSVVDSTNLPLQFGDDVTGGIPVTDWDSELGGDLVAPSLTLPEIGDLLTDLDEDLKNTDTDTDTDNPNKGVEKKITQLTNKLHNDLSKVIDYLKKILDKLTEFFNKFIDIFDNFFENLGEFFESVFVPQDDYFNNVIMDIKAEFDEAFSFGSSLKINIDYFLDCYNTTPSNSVTLGGYKISFSIFDKVINVIRYTIAIPIYFGFAFRTYRKLPAYIKGGASE